MEFQKIEDSTNSSSDSDSNIPEINEEFQAHPHHENLPCPRDDFQRQLMNSDHPNQDIIAIDDQKMRISELIGFNCFTQNDELDAFQDYLSDCLKVPFDATWKDPDEPQIETPVHVISVSNDPHRRRGILFQSEVTVGETKRTRNIVAEHIIPQNPEENKEKKNDETEILNYQINLKVLSDYKYWIDEVNGLLPDGEFEPIFGHGNPGLDLGIGDQLDPLEFADQENMDFFEFGDIDSRDMDESISISSDNSGDWFQISGSFEDLSDQENDDWKNRLRF